MVRIPTYEAKQPYEVAPKPQIHFDTSVGEAMDSLGRNIQRAGVAIADASINARAKADQRAEFNAEQQFQLLTEQGNQARIEAGRNAPADGTGLTASTLQQWDKSSNDFYKRLPTPELQEKFAPRLTYMREKLKNDASNDEWTVGNKYSADYLNDYGKNVATKIGRDPQTYDQMVEEGHRLIDTTPNLTTAQRQSAHQSLDQLSKVALGQGILATDPEAAKYMFGSTDMQGRYDLVARRIIQRGLIHQESGGNPNAVSPKNAIGLTQIWYPTSLEIAKELGDTHMLAMSKEAREAYLKNPAVSIRYGTYYLTKQLTTFNGNISMALAAYNAGPGAVQKAVRKYGNDWLTHMPAETRNYVPSIMARLGNEKYLDTGSRLTGQIVYTGGSSEPSTEQSITIESDGKWVNIPTIIDGQKMSDKDATDLYVAGVNPSLGEYGSKDEAVSAAEQRSAGLGADAAVATGQSPFFSPAFEGVPNVTMKQWQAQATAQQKKEERDKTAAEVAAEEQIDYMLKADPETKARDGIGLVSNANIPKFEAAVRAIKGNKGEAALQAWRRERLTSNAAWIATHDIHTISTAEIEQRRHDLLAAATPEEEKVQKAYDTAADAEIKLRQDDPGKAVLGDPTIYKMYQDLNQNNSDEVIDYLSAVEKKQIELGMLSPRKADGTWPVTPRLLPKDEAKFLGEQFRNRLSEPGADPAAITQEVLGYFRDGHYGEYGDAIFLQMFAETLDKDVSADTRLVVASTMKDYLTNRPTPSRPGRASQFAAKVAADLAASDKALSDETKQEGSWWQTIKSLPESTYKLIFGDGETEPPTDVERGRVKPGDSSVTPGGGQSLVPGVDKNSLDFFLSKYPDVNVLSDFEKRFGRKAVEAATKIAREKKKPKNE